LAIQRLLLTYLLCWFAAAGSLYAEGADERESAPWLQPEIVEASRAIQMTVTQQGIFREAVGGFLDGLIGEYVSMLKQQKDDIPRRAKQVQSRHARKMDKKMRAVLDEQQYERYLAYRLLLLTSMEVLLDLPSRTQRRGRLAAYCKKETWRVWCYTDNSS